MFRNTIWIVNFIPGHIQHLIRKLFESGLTTEEKQRLDEWYHSLSSSEVEVLSDETEEQFGVRMKHRLDRTLGKKRAITARLILLRAAAAVLLIGGSIISYKLLITRSTEQKYSASTTINPATDIAPGANKATLTLGNGSTIILDSNSGKSLAEDGGINIIKVRDGQVEYKRTNEQTNYIEEQAKHRSVSTEKLRKLKFY